MNSLIITSARIFVKDDEYYIDSGLKATIDRYKQFFGNVTLFGMDGSDKGRIPKSAVLLDNTQVKIMGTLKDLYFGKADSLLSKEIPQYDLLILRVPSVISNNAARIAKKMRKPYLVEVIGDAFGSLWYHSLRGKVLAIPAMIRTKKTIKHANYAVYVSKFYLQSKYPCVNKSVGVSDCVIEPSSPESINKRIEHIRNFDCTSIKIMNAAAIDVKYKGQQYVIRAMARLKENGIKSVFYIVGAGDKTYLERIAQKYGVDDQVVFTGVLPHENVLQLMETTDVYIQPSQTEALPRSVVEALSKGCCCIGSDIGGIKELIPNDYRVKPKDYKGITDKILKYINLSVSEKESLCYYYIDHSKNYEKTPLDKRRNDYYQYVYNDVTNNTEKLKTNE